MKCQFLGDSKDSFKWDYLHFLTENLGCNHLKIAWMMTPDDNSEQGKTKHTDFPARPEILELCKELRATRAPFLLERLPSQCGAQYEVSFHGLNEYFTKDGRTQYFRELTVARGGLLFLDPDNGFKPDKSFEAAHVAYDEIAGLLERNPTALITVFHHFRRVKFQDDFAQISERLGRAHASAIYWDGNVMLVNVSACQTAIRKVQGINLNYATTVCNRPNRKKSLFLKLPT